MFNTNYDYRSLCLITATTITIARMYIDGGDGKKNNKSLEQ